MVSKLSFLAAALLSLVAAADALPPPGPGPVPTPGPRPIPHPVVANVIYSCPPGPGYLKATFVDGFGYHLSKINFTGNRQECERQAAMLTALRPQLAPSQLIALCTTASSYVPSGPRKTRNIWFQRQYTLDIWGGLIANLPLVEYDEDYAKCLADAEAINKR